MLALMASWLTPTSLFLLLNIMIGTIFLISHLSSPKAPHHQQFGYDGYYSAPPLQRAPSLLDRVKSINFSTYKFSFSNQDFDHHLQPQDSLAAHPLERSPSILERVKSINFSCYKYFPQNPDTDYVQPTEHDYTNPQPLSRAPSLLERLKSTNFSYYKYSPQNPDPDCIQPMEHDDTNPQPLSRAPSLVERVKSIDFTSFYRSDSVKSNQVIEPTVNQEPDSGTGMSPVHGQVKRIQPEPKVRQRKLPEKMKKSASENSRRQAEEKEKESEEEEEEEEVERRRPATTRIEKTISIGDDDQGVDAKADDFINKFKQQLKLQRLDSLLRYRDMLKGK